MEPVRYTRQIMRILALLAILCAPALASADTSVQVPNVDLSGMSEVDKGSLVKLLQKYPSACGKAQSLEASLKSDPKCRRSVFAARYMVRLFKLGLLPSEVEEHYGERFGSDVYKYKNIDVKDSPVRGDPGAPISIVEFSDFQCPHCKHAQPVLERILEEFPQVKLYFKHYPITRAHPYAQGAAQAAVAAGKQGKFWQYHDKLFRGDQEKESPSDLERYARELKLDLAKWKKDIDGAVDKVNRDRAEGEKVNVDSTPSFFINGRKFHGPPTYEEMKDWVEEELNK
ncbi:MAG: Na+/H+ antiporter NhaA type [Myxococcales bacterium]|nr:Na+/H+ antiporter NhaA type [Myxococcales bacterium]